MDVYKQINDKQYNILRDIPKQITNEYAKTILSVIKHGDNVIDVGFGSGIILIPLAFLNDKANIHGVDYSKPLYDSVKKTIKDKAVLYNKNFFEIKDKFNVVHFKAMLHCFENPELALNRLSFLTKEGGFIITGHESSQIEDRIEQILEFPIEDKELEMILSYYFQLRLKMYKPYYPRKFPAGNANNAVKYLCTKENFKLIKKVEDKTMHWQRKYTLQDILFAIKQGTYNVFSKNLTEQEREYLYNCTSAFAAKHNFDTEKERTTNAKFEIFILQKQYD